LVIGLQALDYLGFRIKPGTRRSGAPRWGPRWPRWRTST